MTSQLDDMDGGLRAELSADHPSNSQDEKKEMLVDKQFYNDFGNLFDGDEVKDIMEETTKAANLRKDAAELRTGK